MGYLKLSYSAGADAETVTAHRPLNPRINRVKDNGSVTLEDDSIRTLQLIRNTCSHLATLRTSLKTTAAIEYAIDAVGSQTRYSRWVHVVRAAPEDRSEETISLEHTDSMKIRDG